MKAVFITVLTLLLMLIGDPAFAQTSDLAAERARLANERIQIEAERRAREENQRQQQVEAEARVRAEAEATVARTRMADALAPRAEPVSEPEPEPAPVLSPASPRAQDQSGGADLSRTLEQLQKLGELRDAGYLTADEFQRIKSRILDTGL